MRRSGAGRKWQLAEPNNRGRTLRWSVASPSLAPITESVLPLGSDLLFVQAKVIRRVKSAQVNPHGGRGTEEDAGVVTYVLSARTGQLLTRAPGAPLIGTATGTLAVSLQQDPFPRVSVVPWRESRR
jgi:hypothetical protein